MSTQKPKQPRGQKPKKGDAEPEVFVLPPDILQKLGINLGNIVSPKEVLAPPVPEHVVAVNTPKPEVSVQHTKLHPKDKGGESTKKHSSILETAILMKKSVFLSPTFTTTGSYISGELEMSIGTELDVEGNLSIKIEPTHHNVNVRQKPLDITREQKQTQNEVKRSITSNNVLHQVVSVNKQPNSINTVQCISVPSTVIGNHKQAILTDDHTDEAYLSDCSSINSTNSSPSQNSTDSMNTTKSQLKERLQSNVSHNHKPIEKIKILSSEKLSSSQIKKFKRDNVPKISDFIPVPVDAVIEKNNLNMPAKEISTPPPSTTVNLDSVCVVESDVFNEIDAAQQLIELADIINVTASNIPIAQEEAVQHMLKDTERLCLDTYMVQDKPDVSTKQDETIDLEGNEKAMENHPDVPSDVSIDFMVTNIEDNLEGEDEILDNLVKHLDSNDMIESNNEEINESGDAHKISEEIMIGSDCSEMNVSLDDIQLQSIDHSFCDKPKLINIGEKTFSENKQAGLNFIDDNATVQTTYKKCVVSNISHTEEINEDSYTNAVDNNVCSENNIESAYMSELVSVGCKLPKLDVCEEGTSKKYSSNLSSFPCTPENINRHCAIADLGKSSLDCQDKKKCQTKLDRYFTVTPKRNGTVQSKDTVPNDAKDKVGEIAMILKQVINTRKSSQARQTNANRYLCSKGDEKPGGSRIKVYKRKPKKCNSEIKANVCQIENKTISTTEEHVVKVYSRKARKSHDYTDMEFKIHVKNMQPDLEETEPKFCNCGDFGSLIYYDCRDVYEHIHFWSHRSTNCSAKDIFLIYEDHDSSVVRNSSDKSVWEDDVPQNVSSNSICWNDVDFPEESCMKQDKIQNIGTENEAAKFVADKQEIDGKTKCVTDHAVTSIDTDKTETIKECIETNEDSKFQGSELCDKELSQGVDQKEELISVVLVLNDSGEDNLNTTTESIQPVPIAQEIENSNFPLNSSSGEPIKSKTFKPVKSSMRTESKKALKTKESQETDKSTPVNVQKDSDPKKRQTRKFALSLNKNKCTDQAKPSTSEKSYTPNTQHYPNKRLTRKSVVMNPEINFSKSNTSSVKEVLNPPKIQESGKKSHEQPDVLPKKRLSRESAVTPVTESIAQVKRDKPSEPSMYTNSQPSGKTSSSNRPDLNKDNNRRSLRSADEKVKESKENERKSTEHKGNAKSSNVLEQEGKNTKRKSTRKSTILTNDKNLNESVVVQPKLPESIETVPAPERQVTTEVVSDPTTSAAAAPTYATTKSKKRESIVIPSTAKSKGDTKIPSPEPHDHDPRTTDIPIQTNTPSDPDIPSVSKRMRRKSAENVHENTSEDVPLSKNATRQSKRHSRRVSSIDVNISPDEDAPLSSMKFRKRRIISSDDESLKTCKRQSVMAPSEDRVTCGVCSKDVDDAQWSDHVAKKHGYLAWKRGEPPLDTTDEKSVSQHLSDFLKRFGTLTCSVCGFKRKSVKAYLQHMPKCEKSTKTDSKDNWHKDESNKSSGGGKCDSVAEVKCGVCHETVAEKSWINHIQKTHDYRARKHGEQPLDLNNEEEVFEHLYAICKEAGSLICKKCGVKRVYVKKYLEHCRHCDKDEADTTATPDLGDVLSQDIYTCGLCSKKIPRKKWPDHKMIEHYNVAWVEGEQPVDIRQTWMIEKLLKEYINAGHKFACNLCGLKRASRLGFYAHVIVCGKTEEEVDKLKLTCTVCNKKFLAIYETQHYGWHKQAEANILRKELEKEEMEKSRLAKLEEKETFVPGGKRRAATKAIEVIQKYKTENNKFEQVCSVCGFETDTKERLKQHVFKCKRTDNQSENFDVNALGGGESDEGSDEDSFSGDTEKDSDEDEQPTRRIRKKPEHQHDNSTRYPRQVPDLTRFLQQSTREFCQLHLSGKNLYPNWRTRDIELVPEGEMSKYMQPAETSCKVKINEEWITFKNFSAKKIKGYCLFVGSVTQAISWAPPQDDSSSNYLAISCHRDMEIPRLGTDETAAYPGLIQIWDFGTFDKIPEFVLGLAHEHGAVWALDWCPSGAQDPMPEDVKSESIARMGLLAIACSNGAAFIYPVPYPPATAEDQTAILKLRPAVELRLSMRAERKTYQATSLRWSPQKDHALIVVGYSDGTTAYYDLKNETPLLKTKENDLTVIFPYYDEMVLSNSVADVDVYPSMDPDILAGAVCSGSPAGVVATLVASQPTRLASTIACRSTKFQPLWPAVMLSSDSAVIRSVANEMEWSGHGRSMGSGGIAATCLRCTCAIFNQPPLLRLMMPHPAGSDINRKSLASLQVVELKSKRKQDKNDATPFIEPTTYEEAVQHYGLEFKLDKSLPAKALMIGRDGWSAQFPLADVQGMAFCPSSGHHHRLAVATFAGLVFLVDTS